MVPFRMRCVLAAAGIVWLVSPSHSQSPVRAHERHMAGGAHRSVGGAPPDVGPPHRFVIVDLTAATSARSSGAAAPITVTDTMPRGLSYSEVDGVTSCDAEGTNATLAGVSKALEGSSASTYRHRWLASRGAVVHIIVLHLRDRNPTLAFAEADRRSRIDADLRALAGTQAAPTEKVRVADASPPPVCRTSWRRRLGLVRATLTIKVSLQPAETSAAEQKTSAANSGGGEAVVQLLTGPRELVFLSASAGVSSARQVRYLPEQKRLDPSGKPRQVFVGVHLAATDLLDDSPLGWSFRDVGRALTAGVLLEASTRPFSQVALTLGVRRGPPWLERYVSIDAAFPFVGVVWARNDEAGGMGSRFGRGRFMGGLSLNISRLAGLQPKAP